MENLCKNKHWEINKDFKIDQVLYTLISEPGPKTEIISKLNDCEVEFDICDDGVWLHTFYKPILACFPTLKTEIANCSSINEICKTLQLTFFADVTEPATINQIGKKYNIDVKDVEILNIQCGVHLDNFYDFDDLITEKDRKIMEYEHGAYGSAGEGFDLNWVI